MSDISFLLTDEKFKTLVLQLRSNSRHPDPLDTFVDQTITGIRNTLISNKNDLRQRIEQTRPDPYMIINIV
jgi:hypothetical protein